MRGGRSGRVVGRCVAGRAALVGAAAVIVVVVLVAPDYRATRGHPVEVATVTAQTMTGDLTTCGKDIGAGSYVQRTSFTVDHPAAGLPGRFTYWGCPLDASPGESVRIVRLGPIPGDGLYIEPMSTLGQVARFVAGWAGAATAGAVLYFSYACRRAAGRPSSRATESPYQ